MKLPNGENAQIDMNKLTGYLLSPTNDTGRHKARVFQSALGIGPGEAYLLRDALADAARDGEAVPGEADRNGRRYSVDFWFEGPAGSAWIRSGWIIDAGSDTPRFLTAYVLRRKGPTNEAI